MRRYICKQWKADEKELEDMSEQVEWEKWNHAFDDEPKRTKDVWAAIALTHRLRLSYNDSATNARLMYVKFKGDAKACIIQHGLPGVSYEQFVQTSTMFEDMPYLKFGKISPQEYREYIAANAAYRSRRLTVPM